MKSRAPALRVGNSENEVSWRVDAVFVCLLGWVFEQDVCEYGA